MISRVITLTQQLLFDIKLSGYWLSRGLITSVYFLFGILLRESGYSNFEVIVAWMSVYISQATLLLALDYLNKKYSGRHQMIGTLVPGSISIAGLAFMSFTTIDLLWFSASAILMLPLLRESIHTGTLYIRDQEHWSLGKNLASLYANEMGKGFGAFFIFALGYLSNINGQYVAVFILSLLIVSIFEYLIARHRPDAPDFTGDVDIGPGGRGYVRISMLHNACFFGVKAILTLVVFDVLSASRDINSVITTLATVVSIMMVVGLVVLQIFKDRFVQLLRKMYKTHFITQSIGLITLVVIALTITTYLFAFGFLEATTTGYLLSIGIALLMAFGGLFSLGALQYLDDVFWNPEDTRRDDKRKTTLHHAWVSSSFSPAILLGIYCVGTLLLSTMINALLILTIISVVEIIVTLYSYRLSLAHTRSIG